MLYKYLLMNIIVKCNYVLIFVSCLMLLESQSSFVSQACKHTVIVICAMLCDGIVWTNINKS